MTSSDRRSFLSSKFKSHKRKLQNRLRSPLSLQHSHLLTSGRSNDASTSLNLSESAITQKGKRYSRSKMQSMLESTTPQSSSSVSTNISRCSMMSNHTEVPQFFKVTSTLPETQLQQTVHEPPVLLRRFNLPIKKTLASRLSDPDLHWMKTNRTSRKSSNSTYKRCLGSNEIRSTHQRYHPTYRRPDVSSRMYLTTSNLQSPLLSTRDDVQNSHPRSGTTSSQGNQSISTTYLPVDTQSLKLTNTLNGSVNSRFLSAP
jgi:hypothetical protein